MSNPWFTGREKCPACGSTTLRTLYESPFDEPPVKDYLLDFYSPQGRVESEYLRGAVYALCECRGCGLIFQRDIPNDELMERLYDHWIDPEIVFNREQEEHGLGYYAGYAQEIMQVLAFSGKAPHFLNVLDFGMGWGKWALMAKAFGCDAYGTELSLQRIEYAKANGIKVIAWDEIPEHRFDFINAEQVFEHLPEPLMTLRHLAGSLKTDGVLRVSVPAARGVERRLRTMDWSARADSSDSLRQVAPLEHINCFRGTSLAGMARTAGMVEVAIPARVQYGHRIDWSGPRTITKNILRPPFRSIVKRQNRLFLRNASQGKA